jgi:prepilin-type N-terminal cleavage/methylation domain-containing protein
MQLRNQLTNQKGFTLIEVAIVLVIVGIVIGGIWVAAATVIGNNKNQTLSSGIIQFVQNIKALYASQPGSTSTSLTVATAIAAGIVPANMTDGTNIFDPFNPGTANITVVGAANTVDMKIGALTTLPANACATLVTTIGSAANVSKMGITTLNANGTSVLSGTAPNVSADPGTVATNCGKAFAKPMIEVVFASS